MKPRWTEIRPRFGFLLIVLAGFLWYKSGGMLQLLLGLLGGALTVGAVVKTKRPAFTGTFLGWGYWLLAGWKGQGLRVSFAHAATMWGGDGSSLTTVTAFAAAMIYTAICWKFADVPMDAIPVLTRFLKQDQRAQQADRDWQPIFFVLGEEKTQEDFRLGGE